jgi:hypothetical protein
MKDKIDALKERYDMKFFSDPGHGWLRIKRSRLQELGIEEKISGHSYQQGEHVYLEEDMDMSTYLNAEGIASTSEHLKYFWYVAEDEYQENTPIRKYPHYKLQKKAA